MDNGDDLIYFVNSTGKRVVLSSPENRNYWELRGRSGFTAPQVDLFTETFASGITRYFGKAEKPRTCSMRMVCVGQNSAERDRIFFEMLDTLLDSTGTGEGRLYVRKSDGSEVFLKCVYYGGMDIVEQYQKINLFTLTFYAADPIFYREIIIDFNGKSTFEVTNPKTFDLYPMIYLGQISISSNNIKSMANTTTGKSIVFYPVMYTAYNYASFSNVEINTGKPYGTIYGKKWAGSELPYKTIPELVNNDLTTLNFPLAPGSNTITYDGGYFIGKNYTFTVQVPYAGV